MADGYREPLTSFVKGAILLSFAVLLIWGGTGVRNDSCGIFGSPFICELGSLAIVGSVILLSIGVIEAAVSLIDFFRDR